MTDNDIAMIAELHTWNKDNGIPVKSLWCALEEIYGNDRDNIASEFYRRMKEGKFKNRGRPRCTHTNSAKIILENTQCKTARSTDGRQCSTSTF